MGGVVVSYCAGSPAGARGHVPAAQSHAFSLTESEFHSLEVMFDTLLPARHTDGSLNSTEAEVKVATAINDKPAELHASDAPVAAEAGQMLKGSGTPRVSDSEFALDYSDSTSLTDNSNRPGESSNSEQEAARGQDARRQARRARRSQKTVSSLAKMTDVSASSVGLAELWCKELSAHVSPEIISSLSVFVRLISQRNGPLVLACLGCSGWTCFPCCCTSSGFSGLPFAEREAMLLQWSQSTHAGLRSAFLMLQQVSLRLFFSRRPEPSRGPYSGLLPTISVGSDCVLDADVVVVGSGPGGCVSAFVLARAGLKVLLLEKGNSLTSVDEQSHSSQLESGGLLFSETAVNALAGSCVGGGSSVGWDLAARPSHHLLQEWATQHGLIDMVDPDGQFLRSLRAVSDQLGLDSAAVPVVPEEKEQQGPSFLEKACASVGFHTTRVQRVPHWQADAKHDNDDPQRPQDRIQGSQMWLRKALDLGVRLLPNCFVDTVTVREGRAVGVTARVMPEVKGDRKYRVSVRATAVVVAGGALHTPALLLRSRLRNKNIGRRLHLQPQISVTGEFDDLQLQRVRREYRRQRSSGSHVAVCDQFVNSDGLHYGCSIRAQERPPDSSCVVDRVVWRGASQFKEDIKRRHMCAELAIVSRDRDSGHLVLDSRGQPQILYKLSGYDAEHLTLALQGAAKLLVSAGATRIYTCQSNLQPLELPVVTQNAGEVDQLLDKWLIACREAGLKSAVVSSEVQTSTCAMGVDPFASVVDAAGEAHEVRGLYVADASALPTSLSCHPMLTVMAMAHAVATGIVQNWKARKRSVDALMEIEAGMLETDHPERRAGASFTDVERTKINVAHAHSDSDVHHSHHALALDAAAKPQEDRRDDLLQ